MAAFVQGYRLVRRIAAGGMAEVYLAEREDRRPAVAIKRLLSHLEADARFATRLREEARLGFGLRHPNVVEVEGCVEDRGLPHLVMELVDGVDLARLRWRLRRPAPLAGAASLVSQAASALAHVHACRIVHGDVTPANLMVTLGGRAGRLKLCDFGVARTLDDPRPPPDPLAASAAYLAPEQLGDGEAIRAGDARADVFALAVCAWELLTGRSLFTRDTAHETLAAVSACRVPPLRAFRPDVPHALSAILERGLDPDPVRRPAAPELGDPFERVAARHPDARSERLAGWLVSLAEPRSGEPTARAPSTITLRDGERLRAARV